MNGSRARAVPADAAAGRRSAPRVLFVSSHAKLGGSERVLLDLVTALPPADVAGVVCLEDGPFVDRMRTAVSTTEVVPTGASPLAMLRSARALARCVKASGAQVVHANGVKAALVSVAATTARTRHRVPVVWMKHDVVLDGRIGTTLARRCAAVACVSTEVSRGVARSGRAVVVHPGVSVDRTLAETSGAALRRRLGMHGAVVTVLGRLDPAKGHAEVLEALPDLLAAVPGTSVLLAGADDPAHPGHRESLRRRAAALGVDDHVRLLDHLDAHEAIGASDVVCVPTVPRPDGSGREGFGLVTAEAMALGVPVVAYDVGATAEVLGRCGALVPLGDRRGLTEAVIRVLSDEGVRSAEQRCGLTRAADLTAERMTRRMQELYEEAVR